MNKVNRKSILVGSLSFFIVLFTMPLGHALMILMEHFLTHQQLYYSAFAMGVVGLVLTIVGVFANGDTRQTLFGMFGALLFWTGWIEFGYVYFAHRLDVQPLLNAAGEVITKPEYLMLPSSVGFWVMFMFLYLFSIKSGCDFFNYLQKIFFKKSKTRVEIKPITRNTSLVTFMEMNMILWTSYLLLMFAYDENFLGDRHPVTIGIAVACLIGSFFMMARLIKISSWGYAIRYSIPTVIVFWTFVEVLGRHDVFKEIWVHPLDYKTEMLMILAALVVTLGILLFMSSRKKQRGEQKDIEPDK